jgi:putative transposase
MLIFGDHHLHSILWSTRSTTTEGTPRPSCQVRPQQPDDPIAGPSHEPIRRRFVLGGLINEYEQAG